ncbi:MAG: hypothetical protein PHV32_06685 [Eubacteriales bacterium]|nr:hypothetical protein [Eubacteriales bacterium]
MKFLKALGIFALILVLMTSMAACGEKKEPTSEITEGTTTAPVETEPVPTGPQLLDGYDDAVIVATDTSPEEWKSKAEYICEKGEIPKELKMAILQRGKTFKFAPGEHNIQGPGRHIYVGTNAKLVGAYKINQPDERQEVLYPDPTYMAVFKTAAKLPSEEWCSNDQFGIVGISGQKNAVIDSIAISGHAMLKLDNARSAEIRNVLIHNYRGEYPNGEWCNMGYGRATGSLWISGQSQGIEILNCQVQFSSHHGIDIHSSSNSMVAKDIHIAGTRALYCGCGMLRGENESSWNGAAQIIPETNGHGYLDWSTAFDLCESQNVQNLLVEDCYALEGWKTNFYTEPEGTGGPITNLKLVRCVGERAGVRTLIPKNKNRETIIKEGENANFYMQGGYFEDCKSIEASKAGWYLNPNRPQANKEGNAKIRMINCGDVGSYISLITEMFDSSNLHVDGFYSINPMTQAMWLFGTTDFQFKDLTILCKEQTKSPILIGYMLRMQFRFSRDYSNKMNVARGGKYDKLRANITDSSMTGTVYNLPDSVPMFEFKEGGGGFNGETDPNSPNTGITLTRDNTTVINVEDYINR